MGVGGITPMHGTKGEAGDEDSHTCTSLSQGYPYTALRNLPNSPLSTWLSSVIASAANTRQDKNTRSPGCGVREIVMQIPISSLTTFMSLANLLISLNPSYLFCKSFVILTPL